MNLPKKSPSQKRAIEYALWLLGRRARTQKEIEKKLQDKEYSQADVSYVISRLCELEFINDLEYAKNYIRQSKIIKPKGKYRLTQELLRRGVEKETITSALAEEFGDEEQELVERTLRSYFKKVQNLPREKQYNRAMGYLLRRGFTLDESKKAVKKFLTSDFSSDNL